MQLHRTQGIILSSLNFKDYDRITTVFTLDAGLIKLLLKGANSAKNGRGTSAAPLTQAEIVYAAGRGDLFFCREISVLNQHLCLRQSLSCLEAGCELLQTVLATQMPLKPAPNLYQLLAGYLEQLPFAADPFALAASFRLKVMRHDGVFGIGPQCSICQQDLARLNVLEGESFCEAHKPGGALEFTAEESGLLLELAFSRSYARLREIEVDSLLQAKIKRLPFFS